MTTVTIDYFPMPPAAANDVPLVVMIAPQAVLDGQRAVFASVGVRFLGFRYGETALLALMSLRADVIVVATPVDMTPSAFMSGLLEQGETAPVAIIGQDGLRQPRTAVAARSLLTRVGVLSAPLRLVG